MPENNNCLQGYKCPKCGSLGPFWIAVSMTANVLMSDDGTMDQDNTDTYWEGDAVTTCPECGYEGIAWDFNPDMKFK